MRQISHRSVAVCIGGAAAAMAICGAILNYGAAKVMSPGEAANTLAWAAAISEAIKLSWLAGFRVGRRWRETICGATLLGVGVLLHGYTMIAVLGSWPLGAMKSKASAKAKSTPAPAPRPLSRAPRRASRPTKASALRRQSSRISTASWNRLTRMGAKGLTGSRPRALANRSASSRSNSLELAKPTRPARILRRRRPTSRNAGCSPEHRPPIVGDGGLVAAFGREDWAAPATAAFHAPGIHADGRNDARIDPLGRERRA